MDSLIRNMAMKYAYERATGHWTESDIEGFAAQIVEACADLCTEIDGGENEFSRGIRRHFGII